MQIRPKGIGSKETNTKGDESSSNMVKHFVINPELSILLWSNSVGISHWK